MAITATLLEGSSSGTDASSYSTASYTPSAYKLVIAAICAKSPAAGGTPPTPTLSGNGLTWVLIDAQDFVAVTNEQKIALFRAMGSAPTTGATTIDFAGDTQDNCCWSIVEFGNVKTGGTNGSDAVVQSVKNRFDNDADGVCSVTLATFASSANATYGAFGSNQGAFTPGSGFTELHDVSADTNSFLASEWKDTNDTTVDGTRAGVTGWQLAAIGIEIAAQVGGQAARRTLTDVG